MEEPVARYRKVSIDLIITAVDAHSPSLIDRESKITASSKASLLSCLIFADWVASNHHYTSTAVNSPICRESPRSRLFNTTKCVVELWYGFIIMDDNMPSTICWSGDYHFPYTILCLCCDSDANVLMSCV